MRSTAADEQATLDGIVVDDEDGGDMIGRRLPDGFETVSLRHNIDRCLGEIPMESMVVVNVPGVMIRRCS